MIRQRFKELPRAAQWAIAAAIAVVVFLIYDAGVRPVTQAWNEKAEAMLDDFGNAAGGRQRERKLRSLREPMLALGGVVPPGDESQGNRALQSVVNDVLKRHTVSRDSFKYRGASKLPRGTLRTVVGSGQRMERISGDLKFEARPEAALSIISELEDSPAIESITSVRLSTEAGPGKVRVDLTLEAWVVGSDQRSRGLGGV